MGNFGSVCFHGDGRRFFENVLRLGGRLLEIENCEAVWTPGHRQSDTDTLDRDKKEVLGIKFPRLANFERNLGEAPVRSPIPSLCIRRRDH